MFRGLNLGVDFTGGVVVETNFPQAPNIESLRTALAKAGVANAQVQAFGSSRDILVRLPPDPNAKGDQIGAHILEIFTAVAPGVKLQRLRWSARRWDRNCSSRAAGLCSPPWS